MTTRLNQRVVDGALRDHPPGTQLYCDAVPGLRVKVGQRSASYKYVGTCNDGRNTPVSLTIGRTDSMPADAVIALAHNGVPEGIDLDTA